MPYCVSGLCCSESWWRGRRQCSVQKLAVEKKKQTPVNESHRNPEHPLHLMISRHLVQNGVTLEAMFMARTLQSPASHPTFQHITVPVSAVQPLTGGLTSDRLYIA